jgi:small subunit ribosomal protein S7
MPRRYKPERRIPAPDAVFNDGRVAKFINRLMRNGKKNTAQKVFYTAMARLEGRTEESPLEVFHKALDKARPLVRVKSRRVGGSTYQVPLEVDEIIGEAIASRWLIAAAKGRGGRSMAEKLAAEVLDIYNNQGSTLKKREETHRMAEANRAFAHYRY